MSLSTGNISLSTRLPSEQPRSQYEPSQTDRGTVNDDNEDEWLISCQCDSAKAISTLLSCLQQAVTSPSSALSSSLAVPVHGEETGLRRTNVSTKRSTTSSPQPVTVFCSPTSITFHVLSRAKQMQASVDLQAGLFRHYQVRSNYTSRNNNDNEEETSTTTQSSMMNAAGGEFCVNLMTILECLHVLGTYGLDSTKVSFSYNLTKELFKMELLQEYSGVLVTAAIPGILRTPEDDDDGVSSSALALAFRSSPLAARIIVQSDALRDIIHELELVAGATVATVMLGQEGLELATTGYLGDCVVSLPARGQHVVSLEVPIPPSRARTYPFYALLGSMRGLEIAKETCITISKNGMMAMQHQVVDVLVGDGKPNFVDFILCCMNDDDDDDDEEDGDDQVDDRATASQTSIHSTSRHASQTSTSTTSHPPPHRPPDSTTMTRPADESTVYSYLPEDEDEESYLPPPNAVPLFGKGLTTSLSPPVPTARTVRPRRFSQHGRGRPVPNHSPSQDDSETEDELEDANTYTTSLAEQQRRQRNHRDDDSSPELVYGEQD